VTRQALIVSGSRGFLASRILHLARLEGLRCFGLVREPRGKLIESEVSWETCISPTSFEDWLVANDVDGSDVTFIHAATHFSRTSDPVDVEATLRSNVLVPMQYFESMASAGVSRFVNLRSTWELMEPNPRVPIYAVSKRIFNDAIRQRFGSSIVITGVFIEESLGPNDWRDKLVPQMLSAQLSETDFQVSHPLRKMNFAYSEDLATFLLEFSRGAISRGGDVGFVSWRNLTPEVIWTELLSATGSTSRLISGPVSSITSPPPSIWGAGVPVFGETTLALPEALGIARPSGSIL